MIEKCAFVECPNCSHNTPVPMLLHDYDWKSENRSIAERTWRCVHCGNSFQVQAVRGITKIEVRK